MQTKLIAYNQIRDEEDNMLISAQLSMGAHRGI